MLIINCICACICGVAFIINSCNIYFSEEFNKSVKGSIIWLPINFACIVYFSICALHTAGAF